MTEPTIITPNPLQPNGFGSVESDSTKSVDFHTHDGINSPKLASTGGGVAGNDKDIQFNDGGSFGGDSNLQWNKNAGGGLTVIGHNGTSTGNGGSLSLTAGNGGSTSGDGGAVNISGGDAQDGDGYGGEINIVAGNGDTAGGGGQVYIQSGFCVAGTAGQIYLKGGNGDTGGALVKIESGVGTDGDANGGDIQMILGGFSGGGHRGRLNIFGLPTSSAGLASGDVWLNSNVLTIVP